MNGSNELPYLKSHQNCSDANVAEDNVQQMLLPSSETHFTRSFERNNFDLPVN